MAVGRALPEHYYDQDRLAAGIERIWGPGTFDVDRLARIHRNVRVEGRHLALPIDEYERPASFTDTNDAYIRCGLELGTRAVAAALEDAGLAPADVDHLFFVSVTGIATPSLDARIVNRLDMRADVKRTPVFGLGCVAGAAGIARASDYVRAFPGHVAVLLSVELCSLTLQREDVTTANMIASGLFGDGAAAVVIAGGESGADGRRGPQILATRSVFYRDTEDVMGWRVGADGFRIVLSADVPGIVESNLCGDVDAFLAGHGLERRDVATWIAHPGGPAILEALEAALEVPAEALARTWRSLAEVGNLSSASVLLVLDDTMREGRPEPGSHAMLLAMGPGFCSELVLLRG